jgi:hypothetical protein
VSHVEQRAAELISAANDQVEAPRRLHAQVRALRAEAAARRRRFRIAGSTVFAAAAAAVVLVAFVATGSTSPPTVAEVAALRALDAQRAAPASTDALLAVSAEGLPFPNWEHELDWRATGVRHDELGGRRLTTVLYEKGGRRIAYSIVSGAPLEERGERLVRNGVDLHVDDGVVTWRRGNHLCVVSGDGVPTATLTKLASWDDGGASSMWSPAA